MKINGPLWTVIFVKYTAHGGPVKMCMPGASDRTGIMYILNFINAY